MEKFDINQFGKACKAAQEYYATQPDFETAWKNCQRGDWMLWISKKAGVDIRTLTLAKGKCAATVLHLMKDERSKKAVAVAIAFGEGCASLEELTAAAADAAYAYADADAAVAAAAYAARKRNQFCTAEICRKILTDSIFQIIKN